MEEKQVETENDFQSLYLNEKKRTRIFLISTIAAVVAFAGVGVGLIAKIASDDPKAPHELRMVRENRDFPRDYGRDDKHPGGPGMMRDISSFFNEDGSVNTDKVENLTKLKDRLSNELADRIDDAVSDKNITSDQGNELKKALGIS